MSSPIALFCAQTFLKPEVQKDLQIQHWASSFTNAEDFEMSGILTHQPLFVALKSILVKPFYSNNHAGPGLCSNERILINPPLKYWTKTAFS